MPVRPSLLKPFWMELAGSGLGADRKSRTRSNSARILLFDDPDTQKQSSSHSQHHKKCTSSHGQAPQGPPGPQIKPKPGMFTSILSTQIHTNLIIISRYFESGEVPQLGFRKKCTFAYS